ncbi:ornithine decarboxylase [Naegleria gruberi]|uniref:ornithine decarboxylase n=1 Tax=Naegleria gruberi TaxID=5762 RepID=D2VBN6_NAEGR|nr:ornithine decarboxylase [Naegleria gruberi]EFC45829.1 ornithine decarboxylase [Naegleria gruberi]|eukprot:XP_002678573.1 ornithine decarboxylase [Naegleria gruberi strain NEG-M]
MSMHPSHSGNHLNVPAGNDGMTRVKSIEFLHLGYEQQTPQSLFHNLRQPVHKHEPQAHYNHSEWVASLQPIFENYFHAELHLIKDQESHLKNTVRRIVKKISEKNEKGESFFVVDLSHIVRQIERWRKAMTIYPKDQQKIEIDDRGVRPFYAVKCNPNENIVKVLYMMGCGFDCASEAEIALVCETCKEVDTWLENNQQFYESLTIVNPDPSLEQIKNRRFVPGRDIIFAHPCKQISHMEYAAKVGVELTTLDSVCEIEKIAEHWKAAKCVIRIKTDDSHATVGFSAKFGCSKFGQTILLEKAKALGVNIYGISFHVGTNCSDTNSYKKALQDAAELAKLAIKYGYKLSLIDIGGGFMGRINDENPMETVASQIVPEIQKLFLRDESTNADDSIIDPKTIKLIAEPGRYIVSASHTLVCNVHTVKDMRLENEQLKKEGIPTPDDFIYYLNDGIYGSFNNIVFDYVHLVVNMIMSKSTKHEKKYASTLFGPTCDSLDCLSRGYPLPELHAGDYLFFNNFGAYTTAAASDFNGMRTKRMFYIWRN